MDMSYCGGRVGPEEAVRQVVMLNAVKGVEFPQSFITEMLKVARGEISADDLTDRLLELYGEKPDTAP